MIPNIQNTRNNGIHNGEQTHHQDQVATAPTPVNFRIRKIKNTIVLNPVPCVVALLFSII